MNKRICQSEKTDTDRAFCGLPVFFIRVEVFIPRSFWLDLYIFCFFYLLYLAVWNNP
jgi:hypothetical protein